MDRAAFAQKLRQIKSQSNLAEILSSQYQMPLKPVKDGDYSCCCPFHDEKTPSFRVNAYRYRCFGCGEHGDLFSCLHKLTGKSIGEIAKDFGNLPELDLSGVKEPIISDYDAKLALDITRANEIAQAFFEDSRRNSSIEVADYIWSRVPGKDELNTWGVGYAPIDGSGLVEYLRNFRVTNEVMLKAGLAVEHNGGLYARMRDRMTIPIYSRNEVLVGFLGRVVPREGNRDLPKYVNPPTNEVFKKKARFFGLDKLHSETVIIVEGALDVIALRRHNLPAIAILGTSLSENHIEILNSKSWPEVVVFLFDGDKAGVNAFRKAFQMRKLMNFHAVAKFLPDGMDPDTWVKNEMPIIPTFDFSDLASEKIMTTYIAGEYDRTRLDEMVKPYVLDNIKQGFPHYNVIDYVMQAYPEYAASLKAAIKQMVDDCEISSDGKKVFKVENIKRFIDVWKNPCREVRRLHAKNQQQTKRS